MSSASASGRHTAQLQVAHHLAVDQVDLGDRAVELAGEEGVAAVDREVGVVDAAALGVVDGVLQLHRLRIAEVQALLRLGHDDRRLAVGREVHVVRIVDRRSPCPACRCSGSIGVRLPSVRPSALLATHSVCRSHDGTTCCGLRPTLNVSTTFIVAGSITRRRWSAGWARRRVPASPFDRGAQLCRRPSRCRGCADRPPAACRARSSTAATAAVCPARTRAAVAGTQRRRPQHKQGRRQRRMNQLCVEISSLVVPRLADGGDGLCQDLMDAESVQEAARGGRGSPWGHLPQRRRPCRASRRGPGRVDRQRERGIGHAGMAPISACSAPSRAGLPHRPSAVTR